jgi:glycosyltransferase involved in cell wall biosynthesis
VLVLVGEPWSGQPEGLAAQARRLGIERSVRFAGHRDDVRSLVAAATVCVVSSVGSEENSRAVGEYMAAGRPVVATSVGVIPELVLEGETGLVVPPGDAERLAKGMAALLADAGLAERMGRAGRVSAETRFSPAAFAEGLSDVLERAGVSP